MRRDARRLHVADDAGKETWLATGLGGPNSKGGGKIDLRRFKGPGEMDAGGVFRNMTATASCAGVSVVCSRCGMWLRPCTLARCFPLQTGSAVVPNRSASDDAGSALAWITARTFGGGVAWLLRWQHVRGSK